MIRTLVWKEYREHRIVWLTMAVVNSGALLGLWRMDEAGMLGVGHSINILKTLAPAAALLAWAYGMICGSMLLASEREEGTLSFLDILPVSRFRLWLVKANLGLLLVIGQVVVLCGWLVALRTKEEPTLLNGGDITESLWFFVIWMLLFGVIGLTYGLFFSARGENVLHVIGLTILGQALAAFGAVFLGFIALFFFNLVLVWLDERRSLIPQSEEQVLAGILFGGLTLAALVNSARAFSRQDQMRLPAAVRKIRARASVVASWLRIIWLCDRQMRRLALGVMAFSLSLGVLFLVTGPILWPVATLLLGVLCGVTAFSDEQANGSFRFLGEQRFPLGRIWAIKIGTRFALLLFASFLVLLPSILVALFHSGEHLPNSEARELRFVIETLHLNLIVSVVPLSSYLLLWPLYGFSVGQLCGMLCRKSIVAAMIAVMASAGLAVVWLPSLAGIGLHFWQIAGPPLILLVMSALLVRMWAADRVATRRTVAAVCAAGTLSFVSIAFGLWYRVAEVPNVPEPFDVAAYRASLPTVEQNEAGRLIRGFWNKIESRYRERFALHPKKPFDEQERDVVDNGWPEGKTELGDWLDRTFAGNWLEPLAPLPDLPLGVVLDPRMFNLNSSDLGRWGWASIFSTTLAVRGLQQQARGDPGVFVEHMRIALALSRNLDHHKSFFTSDVLRFRERVWWPATDQWIKKLHGRPDLLKRALQTLVDHDAQFPKEDDSFKADYIIARNTLEMPELRLDHAIPNLPKEQQEHQGSELRNAEVQFAAMMWMFPWERERHERLLRMGFQRDLQLHEQRKIREWGGDAFAGFEVFSRILQERQTQRSRRELANLRVCQLKVALRLYEEENGRLPDSLDALVPRYLRSIPLDPMALGQTPFHYRRSRGEWIVWSQIPVPGQTVPMNEFPGDAPKMPRVDEGNDPDKPFLPAPLVGGGPGRVEVGPLPERIPLMPGAEVVLVPLPVIGMQREDGGPPPGGSGTGTIRYIPKGQGILWSVGEDGQDDGGKEQGINSLPTRSGTDVIYLVPSRR